MKRKILWLGLSFLLVVALVLASCGPAVPVGEQEEEEEEEEEEVEVPILSIGETYQSPKVVITVSEAIVTDSYEYYDVISKTTALKEASPGTSFLIFSAEIENVGDSIRYYEGKMRFWASDSEGNEYTAVREYQGEPRLPEASRFQPDSEMKGKVLILIPEGASGLTILYREPSYPHKKVAEWVIK